MRQGTRRFDVMSLGCRVLCTDKNTWILRFETSLWASWFWPLIGIFLGRMEKKMETTIMGYIGYILGSGHWLSEGLLFDSGWERVPGPGLRHGGFPKLG